MKVFDRELVYINLKFFISLTFGKFFLTVSVELSLLPLSTTIISVLTVCFSSEDKHLASISAPFQFGTITAVFRLLGIALILPSTDFHLPTPKTEV